MKRKDELNLKKADTQKHTHLQAAQANAQTKACKRVCFSPTKEEIQFFFLPPFGVLIFLQPHRP